MKKNILLISTIILFIINTLFVIFNKYTYIDNYIYSLININDISTNIFKIITFFGSTLFIIILCIIMFIYYIVKKNKSRYIYIPIILIINTIINNVLKVIICRDRPVDVVKLVNESTYSYPSGHTMASTLMYGMIIYFIYNSTINKNIKIILIVLLSILILLIMFSRIYLGAHYFSDVVGGLLLSLTVLLVFKKVGVLK